MILLGKISGPWFIKFVFQKIIYVYDDAGFIIGIVTWFIHGEEQFFASLRIAIILSFKIR